MKRIFKKYTEWEDFNNGMYELSSKDHEPLINKSIELLSNEDLFLKTALEVTRNWTTTTKVHLTNTTINKKAWLGQASCSYLFNVPELLTKIAWGKLTVNQQIKANLIASRVITSYLIKLENENNTRLHI